MAPPYREREVVKKTKETLGCGVDLLCTTYIASVAYKLSFFVFIHPTGAVSSHTHNRRIIYNPQG